jgi:1-acyl-sn-glycerol-3-phosphate acyltransferase
VPRLLDASCAELAAGSSVLLFPEGTRSPPGGLHPFGRIALEIASRAGRPIEPMLVTCEPPALGRGVPWYRFPRQRVCYHLRPLAVVHVATGREAVRASVRALESTYHGALGLGPVQSLETA